MHWEVLPAVILLYGAPTALCAWFIYLAIHDLITGRHYGD